MTTTAKHPLPRDDNGKLPTFAWPGGYSVVYYTADYEIMCAKCANGENGSDASEDHEDKQWRLIHADVYWEGPTESCSHCNADIESEYGDPDADDSSESSYETWQDKQGDEGIRQAKERKEEGQ